MRFTYFIGLTGVIASALVARPAAAEVDEVIIALQPGLAFTAQNIMKDRHLVEARLKEAGLENTKVTYRTFGSGGAMNDAVLSGAAHFGANGVPPFITIWDKAKGSRSEVMGCIALDSEPTVALTRDPKLKSLKDIGEGDKISLPSVKVSMQAVLLQMEAAKLYGDDQYEHFDKYTLSLSHPDGLASVLSRGEIATIVTGIPYIKLAEERGLRPIFNAYEVVGKDATTVVIWSGKKFHDENPKTFHAVMEAFNEASAVIKKDPRAAAETYLRVGKEKFSVDFIEAHYKDPNTSFEPRPVGIQTFLDFMRRVGTLKRKVGSWEELFFPDCKQYWRN